AGADPEVRLAVGALAAARIVEDGPERGREGEEQRGRDREESPHPAIAEQRSQQSLPPEHVPALRRGAGRARVALQEERILAAPAGALVRALAVEPAVLPGGVDEEADGAPAVIGV